MNDAARIQSLIYENANLRKTLATMTDEMKSLESAYLQTDWFPDPKLRMPLKEISVCRAFLHRRTPTRENIYQHCYGPNAFGPDIVTIQSHISKVRKKLQPYGISITVSRGAYYEMSVDDVKKLRSLSDLKTRLAA